MMNVTLKHSQNCFIILKNKPKIKKRFWTNSRNFLRSTQNGLNFAQSSFPCIKPSLVIFHRLLNYGTDFLHVFTPQKLANPCICYARKPPHCALFALLPRLLIYYYYELLCRKRYFTSPSTSRWISRYLLKWRDIFSISFIAGHY